MTRRMENRAPQVEIPKARYGTPCNGCGLCCRLEVCGIGRMAFPDAQAPCPAIRFDGEKFRCAIVEMEAASGKEPLIAEAIGIGKGCCSDVEAENA